ncbi:ACT domain-containing protein [Dictyobacter arantiisoli]|uniref:Amino acid-binding protein n=1 Tax=Dictyobacter arantiisoli TaxID=2014874 RepID=A0A5A5T7F8_9CHLR|nr:ACT domain-containing protein [Dictyobacter arantiisoli]GCF07411.1 amino acid-binding protein [Dictyobacter arantiisoli]
MRLLTLFVLPSSYAFCRLHPDGHIPHWALLGNEFISLTRTDEELSVVCLEENVPEDAQAERGWRCIKVEGPFDFSVSGVHASLALPLAEANISVMGIATYQTDYLLMKEQDLEPAIAVLSKAGHTIRRS